MKLLVSLLLLISSATAFAGYDNIAEIARLRQAADSLHSIGRTDSAVTVGAHAIDLAVKSGDLTQIVGTNAAQGVFLRSLGKIDEALERYEEALAIVTSGQFRENPSQEAIEEIASLYINLAVLNLDTQHKDQAAKNAQLSGQWIAKSDDSALRSTVYGVVGSVLTGCGDLADARHFQELAYRDALASGDKEAAFRAAAYTMLIADRSGDKAEAQRWREKCNELMPEMQSVMAKLVYYQAECSICLAKGDDKGSIIWFNRILDTDGIDNLPFVKFDCYNNLHKAYADLGDYAEAYSTLIKSGELRDSLWQEDKAESLRELTVKYETKETELALAQSEARRTATLMWLFAVAALLLIGIIIFIVYANRQHRRRLQKEIEFANLRADIDRQFTGQYIEGLENERRRMSRELHDGICNDLLAIQMNINNGRSIDSTVGMIDSCREAVRRISHELMPPEFTYADIDEVIRFFATKQSEAAAGRVAVVYESSCAGGRWSDIPDNVALDIYRIIQEATGNAIKHSGASQIVVELRRDAHNLEASVRDNGTYKADRRKGIGLESIRRRAKAINGNLSVDYTENGGTAVRLTVSL